jgi:MFS family permease
MVRSAVLFTIVLAIAAAAPTLWLELVALFCVGAVSVGFLSQGSSTLQLEAEPTMRGRVVALWAVAFQGTTPIGGPIAGVISEQFGGRAGLVLAAAACAVAAGIGRLIARRPEATGSPETAGTASVNQ